jgi:AmmeMemoRadiSam system protein A
MDEPDLGHTLLAIARRTIGAQLGLATASEPRHAALGQPAATFVTLKQSGELRGCIGSLKPIRPLGVDVRENAIAAAFRDPRFPPLSVREYVVTSVEVSLLSADERIDVATEADLIAQLRPGIDGLVLQHGVQRATFLPQVWETLPEPREFVAALKRKAGLPVDFWSPRMTVSRYGVTKWAESEFAASEEER